MNLQLYTRVELVFKRVEGVGGLVFVTNNVIADFFLVFRRAELIEHI
jgi:hypothetical protein